MMQPGGDAGPLYAKLGRPTSPIKESVSQAWPPPHVRVLDPELQAKLCGAL